jgi:hypothetical protein
MVVVFGTIDFTMVFFERKSVWHAILSYFYMMCFWPLMVIESNATVRSSDTTQQDAGYHGTLDAVKSIELRRSEEQDKETATVTTEQDDDRLSENNLVKNK